MDQHEYKGVIHVHTRYSDGNRVATAVIEAAQAAGLDFLMITDHNSLGTRDAGLEGWHGRTLVIVGEEITPAEDANHYLAFGIGSPVPETLPPADYPRAVEGRGGIGFIAHPDDIPKPFLGIPAYPWTAWDASRYNGFEIWNYTTDWSARNYNLSQLLRALVFPFETLRGPASRTLARWDDMNRTASPLLVGIVGADAHGYGYTYRRMFRHIRNHVLLSEPLSESDAAGDTRMLLEALARGRVFGALDGWKPADGFEFAADGLHDTYLPGDVVPRQPLRFACRVPHPADIRLLRDGRVIARQAGESLVLASDSPGVYRVEVWGRYHGRDLPWIFSNPIRIAGT